MVKKKKIDKNQLIRDFSDGLDRLDDVLRDLTDADLDLSRSEDKWTIRQIVHHIADAENLWAAAFKAAVANPGCDFDFNWYIADNKCAVPLLYHLRPIDDAVALFRSSRKQVGELIGRVDDAWERSLNIKHESLPKGQIKFGVPEIIQWQAKHLNLHIEQIKETLTAHGR